MGIYQRDNINYQSMIDNMIKNRMHTAERDADRIVKTADIKAQTAKDIASTFARGMDAYQAYSEANELEDKLKELQDQRANLVRAQIQAEQERYNPTSFDYQSRNNTTNDPNRSYSESTDWMVHANPDNYYKLEDNPKDYGLYNFSKKEQWLMDHPGKSEEDYENFLKYMSSIYGG